MNWKRVAFTPVDTLFFRDGRPYHQGETTQNDVTSQFPPSPNTLVGAIRAAYARALGWDGKNGWTANIIKNLGDGLKLNGMKFRGPILYQNDAPLFPVPYCLMGKLPDDPEGNNKPTSLNFLRPGAALRCDMGMEVRLPTLPNGDGEGLKTLEKWWITQSGLESILCNDTPKGDSLIHHTDLWKMEPRIGIQRDEKTRTTKEGAMYSPRHIRLFPNVKLNMFASGLPERIGFSNQSSIAPVGGESRACYLDINDSNLDDFIPKRPDLEPVDGMIYYSLVALTPLGISDGDIPAPNKPFLNLPGALVSACLPRPQRWGGWDSVNRKPLPLKSYIPPGSVFYFEAKESEKVAIENLHGTTIGECQDWGFGLIVIGTWKQGDKR